MGIELELRGLTVSEGYILYVAAVAKQAAACSWSF